MDITPPPDPPARLEVDFKEVGQFLDEVAPGWICHVCGNGSISLYVTQSDGSIPAHVRLDQTTGGLIAFRSFACICDKCGHVYTFDIGPFLKWRKARAGGAE